MLYGVIRDNKIYDKKAILLISAKNIIKRSKERNIAALRNNIKNYFLSLIMLSYVNFLNQGKIKKEPFLDEN